MMTVVVPIVGSKAAADARAERVGVLLEPGTPDTRMRGGARVPEGISVRPRVIEDQGPKWKLVLNGIILRIRPAARRDYRKIWNMEKTNLRSRPLRALSESLPMPYPDHDMSSRLGDAHGNCRSVAHRR
jgi:ferrochelatase